MLSSFSLSKQTYFSKAWSYIPRHWDNCGRILFLDSSLYPVSLSSIPANLSVKYLPSGSSFYSILDAETDEVIVPYGSGSKLSCDSSGNYFMLDLNGYQPERYYRLEYRIQSGSGVDEIDQYFNEGFTFKVTQ